MNRASSGQVVGGGKQTTRVNTNIHSDQLTAVELVSKFACSLCIALSPSLSTNYWKTAVSIHHSEPIFHPFNAPPYIYSCGGMSPFPFCILTTKRKAKVPTFLCLPASGSFALTTGRVPNSLTGQVLDVGPGWRVLVDVDDWTLLTRVVWSVLDWSQTSLYQRSH